MADLQIQASAVVALPHVYTVGCNLSVYSSTVLAIAPGAARDSTNNLDIPVGYDNQNSNAVISYRNYRGPLLINTAVVGAGGLDQGTLASASEYSVYLIADSTQYNAVAGIMTLSSNQSPTMPAGYDSVLLLGFVTTSGSALSAGTIRNLSNGSSFYIAPAAALSAGTATSFTGVDLNSIIATGTAIGVIATFLATYTPAGISSNAQLRLTGSSATAGLPTIYAIAAGVPQQQYINVVCGVNNSSHASIDYKVSSGDSLTLSVVAYRYSTT